MTEGMERQERPWERHTQSVVERRWGDGACVVTGEDLIASPMPIGFNDARHEWCWEISSTGRIRLPLCVWVMRYDPMTGDLLTSIERIPPCQ